MRYPVGSSQINAGHMADGFHVGVVGVQGLFIYLFIFFFAAADRR